MALPKQDSGFRHEVRLTGAQRLDEELGLFGRWVGPRFDAITGSRQRERNQLGEEWCLRRLLIGLVAADRLDYPVGLFTTFPERAEHEKLPDALLCGPSGSKIGIEVTQATSGEWQRHLREIDETVSHEGDNIAVLDPGDGYTSDQPERQAVHEIRSAFVQKLEKLEGGAYDGVREVDLLIYLNSQAGIHVAPDDIAQRLRAASQRRESNAGFRQVHVLFADAIALDVFGGTSQIVTLKGRYEHDYNQWCVAQAERAEEGRGGELDLPNLAEEMRSLGAKDLRALRSHLQLLLHHLLKWRFQEEKRTKSWALTIVNARDEIESVIDDSPSLGTETVLWGAVAKAYPRAVRKAALETGLPVGTFPEECPFSLSELFDPEFPDDLND